MRQSGTNWNKELAARLIVEQGRKHKWVAEQCGITSHWLNAILQGKSKPSVAVVRCLSIALGLAPTDLLKSAS